MFYDNKLDVSRETNCKLDASFLPISILITHKEVLIPAQTPTLPHSTTPKQDLGVGYLMKGLVHHATSTTVNPFLGG